MSEQQVITHRNVGFSWSYSLEIEKVVPVEGTRASAKTTEKFSASGNAETYSEMMTMMDEAREEVKKKVTE